VLAELDTTASYREQAVRLTRLAAETQNPESRIELLEIAAVFHRLAERPASHPHSLTARDWSQPRDELRSA